MKVPKSLTVLVDTREKTPLLFPSTFLWYPGTAGTPRNLDKPSRIKLKTSPKRLDAGDYTLKGYESLVGIERKGSIDELISNSLSADRHRFLAALARFLGTVRYPILFLDCLPTAMWRVRGNRDVDPMQAMDRIFNTIGLFRVDIVWGGRSSPNPATRRRLGELLVRRMLSQVLCDDLKEKP